MVQTVGRCIQAGSWLSCTCSPQRQSPVCRRAHSMNKTSANEAKKTIKNNIVPEDKVTYLFQLKEHKMWKDERHSVVVAALS